MTVCHRRDDYCALDQMSRSDYPRSGLTFRRGVRYPSGESWVIRISRAAVHLRVGMVRHRRNSDVGAPKEICLLLETQNELIRPSDPARYGVAETYQAAWIVS